MKILKNQKGITLIELLIAAFLTALLSAAAMEFYVRQHGQWLTQEQVSDMQQNARVCMDELTKNIRKAGYQLVGQTAFQIRGDTLALFYKDSTIIDTLRFYVSRTDTLHPVLVKKLNAGTPQVYAENIDSVRFVQAGSVIQVTIIARQDRKDEDYSGGSYRKRVCVSRVKIRNAS